MRKEYEVEQKEVLLLWIKQSNNHKQKFVQEQKKTTALVWHIQKVRLIQ